MFVSLSENKSHLKMRIDLCVMKILFFQSYNFCAMTQRIFQNEFFFFLFYLFDEFFFYSDTIQYEEREIFVFLS